LLGEMVIDNQCMKFANEQSLKMILLLLISMKKLLYLPA